MNASADFAPRRRRRRRRPAAADRSRPRAGPTRSSPRTSGSSSAARGIQARRQIGRLPIGVGHERRRARARTRRRRAPLRRRRAARDRSAARRGRSPTSPAGAPLRGLCWNSSERDAAGRVERVLMQVRQQRRSDVRAVRQQRSASGRGAVPVAVSVSEPHRAVVGASNLRARSLRSIGRHVAAEPADSTRSIRCRANWPRSGSWLRADRRV